MSLTKAMVFIPKGQKGNFLQTYQGVDDTTNDAQWALIKAGRAGTDGVLDGVICSYGDYGKCLGFDAAGNAILQRAVDSQGNQIVDNGVIGLIDHFGAPGGFKDALVSNQNGGYLGAPLDDTTTALHAAITMPAADSTTGIHAAIALTAAVQVVALSATGLSCLPTITGNASGILGPVTLVGTDLQDDPFEVTLNLSGSSTIAATLRDLPYGVKTVTQVTLPPQTHAGTDTVALGKSGLVTITGFTQPDVPRVPSATSNASGITGSEQIMGEDSEGTLVLNTIALVDATTVNGTNAIATILSVFTPQKTNSSGDTVAIGTTDILGLPYRMDHDALIGAQFGTTHEATRPTVTYDGTNLCGNTVLLNTDLDGSHQVIVDFIRCDAPLEFDRM